MAVPVVRALAEQHPDIAITVLSQPKMADLFAAMPPNVSFHGADIKKQSLRAIVAGLGRFDLVADLHDVWRSLYIRTALRLRGARVATIRKGRFSKFLLTRGWRRKPLRHTTMRYADVLQRLGLPIRLPRFACKSDGQGIGIAPFAAHQGKIYPLDQMEQVVAQMSQLGEPILLFGGGKKEQELLSEWATRYPNVQSVAGQHSLREELEIMRGLRLMLTMDSANLHLASLVGTRVVSVWGATHPFAGFTGVGQSPDDCVQRDLPCRPCSIYGNKPCKYGDYRCLHIAPEEIIAKLHNDQTQGTKDVY